MNEQIMEILRAAIEQSGSDIFIVAGRPVSMRRHGDMVTLNDTMLKPPQTRELIDHIWALAGSRSMDDFEATGDDDFSFAVPGLARFRVSAYRQRGACSAVIRVISFERPDYRQLGIPQDIIEMGNYSKGMVLVTGPAGSGKSTTLACIIDYINHNKSTHIITLEDPIEYLHHHDKSIVSQREIHIDTESYVTALRAALRQSPDVVLLGEMRDYETIAVAMTAAETGHLLFSTLHTLGAANTINRIIDVFPSGQQRQIAVQLSTVLNAVVSEQLVPTVDGGMIPVFEIMTITPAIRNMIRDNKVYQIDGIISSSAGAGMVSMDASLAQLVSKGVITKETAIIYAANPEQLSKRLR